MNKRRTILGLIAASIAAPHLATANTLTQVKSRGKLLCGVISIFPPFGFQDPKTRELVGYDIDFCNSIAKGLGVSAEFRVVSIPARIPELLQGNIDVIVAGLGWTSERAEQIAYSDAYFLSRQIVAVRADSDIKKLDQLNGQKIAVPQNSTSAQYVHDQLPGAIAVTFPDPPAAFMAFQQGRAVGVAMGELSSLAYREKAAVPFKSVPEALAMESYGVGVRKDGMDLVDAINVVLEKMETSGEAAAIFNKWFGKDTAYGITERYFKVTPIKAR